MSGSESDRINEVYRDREAAGINRLYSVDRPEIVYERALVDWRIARHLSARGFLAGMTWNRILDVGCGRGRQLRIFHEWGAAAGNLYGLDLFETDVAAAKLLSPPGMQLAVGSAANMPYKTAFFDVIMLNTVLSSILDSGLRQQVCAEVRRVLKKSGVILIYDFVYRNPGNPNVFPVSNREIKGYFEELDVTVDRLTIAPPISRRLAWLGFRMLAALDLTLPFLRSHRLYVIQNGGPSPRHTSESRGSFPR